MKNVNILAWAVTCDTNLAHLVIYLQNIKSIDFSKN